MSNHYTRAKHQFINTTEDKAAENGVGVVGRDHPSFLLDNGVVAHVRATRDQYNPIELVVDEEVRFVASADRDDVEAVYTVLLDIRGPSGFSSARDAFYPIPERIITSDHFVTERPSDGHHQLTINLLRYPAKKWQNDWSLLFSPGQGSNETSGSDRSDDDKPGFPSDSPQATKFQRIATECVTEDGSRETDQYSQGEHR